MSTEPRIIGGMFGLPKQELVNSETGLACMSGQPLLLANARSCLYLIFATIKPATVWMPSYLCPSMLQALSATENRVAFYPVDGSLGSKQGRFLSEIKQGDAFVFIDYFGFPGNEELAKAASGKGAVVIQDAAQALLSGYARPTADFVIFSPRKFLGVPDGGILISRENETIPKSEFEPVPENWRTLIERAAQERSDFDKFGGPNTWYKKFSKAEETAPVGLYRMSSISKRLLENSFNYAQVVEKRRRNFSYLLNRIGELALFQELPDSVVPIGFPIITEHRGSLREVLISRKIYPPIHWELGHHVPLNFQQSHLLSKSILTLPCDQRYGDEDMERMVSVVSQHLGVM